MSGLVTRDPAGRTAPGELPRTSWRQPLLVRLGALALLLAVVVLPSGCSPADDRATVQEIALETVAACQPNAMKAMPHRPQNLINYSYCLMLGRLADPVGGQGFQARLEAETLFPRDILLSMYGSDEFQRVHAVAGLSHEQFVRFLYQRLLWRVPGSSDVTFHARSLTQGLSRVQMFKNFIGSDEFVALHPILFDDGGIEAALDNLWRGRASFRRLASFQLPTPTATGEFLTAMNAGTHIVARGGVWYLFNREYLPRPLPAPCTGDVARIVARKSTDRGQTWSPRVIIIEPNLAAGECVIVDGRAYFDVETKTWHYLAQALHGSWDLNHYTRKGEDPLGPFTPDPQNPAVRSGALWAQLCGPGRACPTGTVDEGTPDITFKRGDEYFVTFHGASWQPGSTVVMGYRGVAKTKDFHNWTVTGPDLPGEVIYGRADCQTWDVPWSPRTGCIGAGNSVSLTTYRRTYLLVEAADLTLGVEPGQRWAMGLARSNSFVATQNWEQYPRNPLLETGNVNYLGSVSYMTLFKDAGKVYVGYWTGPAPGEDYDRDSYFHIAELVPTPSPVTTDNKTAQIQTGISILRSFVRGCSNEDVVSLACRAAIYRYCASQGYSAGGWGPVEKKNDALTALCFGGGSGASVIQTTFRDLTAQVGTCQAASPTSRSCMSAYHRYCIAQGDGAGGFGPLEQNGEVVLLSCLRDTRGARINTTFTELKQHQPLCDASAATSTSCASAVNRFCVASGFAGGYGTLESTGTAALVGCARR